MMLQYREFSRSTAFLVFTPWRKSAHCVACERHRLSDSSPDEAHLLLNLSEVPPLALVLCTGADSILMETRKLILERAGHIVVRAMNEREVTTACKMNCFQVAVIGQSVSSQSKRSIAQLVRQHCPSSKIMELYAPYYGKALDDADSWLEVPADAPNELGEEVTRLAEDDKFPSLIS